MSLIVLLVLDALPPGLLAAEQSRWSLCFLPGPQQQEQEEEDMSLGQSIASICLAVGLPKMLRYLGFLDSVQWCQDHHRHQLMY